MRAAASDCGEPWLGERSRGGESMAGGRRSEAKPALPPLFYQTLMNYTAGAARHRSGRRYAVHRRAHRAYRYPLSHRRRLRHFRAGEPVLSGAASGVVFLPHRSELAHHFNLTRPAVQNAIGKLHGILLHSAGPGLAMQRTYAILESGGEKGRAISAAH